MRGNSDSVYKKKKQNRRDYAQCNRGSVRKFVAEIISELRNSFMFKYFYRSTHSRHFHCHYSIAQKPNTVKS